MASQQWWVKNVLIANHDQEYVTNVLFDNGKIIKIEVIDSEEYDYVLLPPFIDSHTHGGYGLDFQNLIDEYRAWEYDEKNHFYTYFQKLPSEGVFKIVPSSVVDSPSKLLSLFELSNELSKTRYGMFFLGWHFEGPFISKLKKGAHNEDLIIESYDEFFNKLKALKEDKIPAITIAPESKENLESIKKYHDDFIFSLGHTNAFYDEAILGIQAGAKKITHLFNAMNPYHHSNKKSLVNLVFENKLIKEKNIIIELIADGKHVDDEVMKLLWNNVDHDLIAVVSDSLNPKGLADDDYKLGSLDINKKGDFCYLKNSTTLAGSAQPYNRILRHFKNTVKCSWSEIVKVSSYNVSSLYQDNILMQDLYIKKHSSNYLLMTPNFDILELNTPYFTRYFNEEYAQKNKPWRK